MKLLVASDYFYKDESINNIIGKSSSNDLIGLALWPDAATSFRENNIKYLTPIELIKNEDHYKLAELITDISNNWWKSCFPDKNEPNIDGLPISMLYPLEIEVNLSPIIYNILTIKRAIELYQIDLIVIVNKKNSNNKFAKNLILDSEDFTKYIANIPLPDVVKSIPGIIDEKNIITLQQESKIKLVKLKPYILRIRRVLALFVFGYFNKILLEIFEKYISKRPLTSKGNILILGGSRCLTGFIKNFKEASQISFIPYKYLIDKNYINVKPGFDFSFPSENNSFCLEGMNFIPLVKYVYEYYKYHFSVMEEHYKGITKLIEKTKPRAYITVDVTKSFGRLNAWGFFKKNIRTIWHGDGLGYITDKTFKIFESYWWPSIPIERWLISKYYKELCIHWQIPAESLKVTGYFDQEFNGAHRILHNNKAYQLRNIALKKFLGVGSKQNIILIVESMIRPEFLRLIETETIFELLKFNKEIVESLGNNDEYFLIFKMHPGFENYLHLFEESIPRKKNIKIVYYLPINTLIDISNLIVLYNSSVGLESLYRKKNILIFNHTNRPGGVSEVYDKMNQDPLKGPAARIAYNKEQLLAEAIELLKYSVQNTASPGLDYLLENATENFSFSERIEKLKV